MKQFEKLTKAVLWDAGTGQVRLWIEDVPLETTREEMVALLTQAAVGVRWDEWRHLRLETTFELAKLPIQSSRHLLSQRDTMKLQFEELVNSLKL